MANWKKVLVSGSSIEVAAITSSATPTITSIGSNYVTMIDPTTGYITKITSGNFQASLGQYAYTASADSGTPIIIGSADTLFISGGLGNSTTIASTAGGAQIAVNLNTGSSHFTSGVSKEVFDAGNFVDSSEVNFTVTAGTSVTAALIDGSIANARLANSSVTVNGTAISLGSSGTVTANTTNTLTLGSGLTGTSFNGSAAVTATVNSGSMLPYYSSSILNRISGDITVNGSTGVAAIGSGKVTNTMLVNSSLTVTAGNGLTGGGAISLGGSATVDVGAGTGITVNSNDVALKNAGSLTNNYVTKWDSGNGQLTNSVIIDSGTLVTIGQPLFVNGAITGSAVSSSGAITGQSVTSATNVVATAGNITTTSGYVTAGNPAGAPNLIGSVQAESIFSSGNAILNSLTVTTDATINGNLTVNGTTTTINTDNLLVEDKFVLFASGSTSATDGGIVVQASAGGGTATGYAYGYENTTDRWVYQDALAYNATAFGTVTAYAVSAEWSAGAPSAAPAYGGASYGYGNIHVNTSTGEIFIYS